MRTASAAAAIVLTATSALAQRPSDPALLGRQQGAELGYTAVPDRVPLPAGTTMGASAAVAFGANGHLFVLTRGPQSMFEFDEHGTFIRTFGDGLFTRAH